MLFKVFSVVKLCYQYFNLYFTASKWIIPKTISYTYELRNLGISMKWLSILFSIFKICAFFLLIRSNQSFAIQGVINHTKMQYCIHCKKKQILKRNFLMRHFCMTLKRIELEFWNQRLCIWTGSTEYDKFKVNCRMRIYLYENMMPDLW